MLHAEPLKRRVIEGDARVRVAGAVQAEQAGGHDVVRIYRLHQVRKIFFISLYDRQHPEDVPVDERTGEGVQQVGEGDVI